MTEPTAQELTDEQIRTDIAKELSEEFVRRFLRDNVQEGRLDAGEAAQMTFEEMEAYVDWSDFMANSYLDYEQEGKEQQGGML